MVQTIDQAKESSKKVSLDEEILNALADMPDALKIEILHYAGYLITKYSQNSEVNSQPETPKKKRQAGLLKGKIWMSDDFDEPLEEMKEYM